MPQIPKNPAREMPSAVPTKSQIAAWADMPRDEQVRRYQEMFRHPDCNSFTADPPRTFSPLPGGKLPRAGKAEELE